MACWNVGRLVQRMVKNRKPGEKKILSAEASDRQTVGSGLANSSSSSTAACSSASHSESLQVTRSPAPQNFVLNLPATGRPASVRRSFST